MNSLTEDLGIALGMMVVAAVLGGLLVYIWIKSKYSGLEPQIHQLSGEISELKSRNGALEDRLRMADQRTREEQEKLDASATAIRGKELALADAETKIGQLQHQVRELTPFKDEFEDLQSRYKRLEESIRELQGRQKTPRTQAVPAMTTFETSATAEELAREKAIRLSLQQQLDGLRPFRQKYEQLKVQYDALQAGAAMAMDQDHPESGTASADTSAKQETQEETLARIQERAKEINFERIGVASPDEKNDLKVIKGIGPFIEKKLNSIGIYTYRQIAAFTEEDEDKVNEVIEFFPGRIRRDNWRGQSADLKAQDKG